VTAAPRYRPRVRYAFGDFEVDEGAFELRRARLPVEIQRKPLELLIHLLRCHPAMCSKDQLLDELWPDSVVTEASLTRAVRAVRRALGEAADRGGIIRTVRGRGYGIAVSVEVRGEREADASAQQAGAPSERAAPSPPSGLVGRERELARLEAICEEARAGRGGLVLLVGEPGIGKTRTVEELARRAAEAGVEVLWGRCLEEPGAPGYWPWVQIVRSALASRSGAALVSQLGVRAAAIAGLVPELLERLPDLATPPRLDPEQERFHLHDALARFLVRASGARPLLLVLEDLHWADPSSLQLLRFLAPELGDSRVLVLGTRRDVGGDAPAMDHTLAQLARLPHVRPAIPLTGLAEDEVARLVLMETGKQPAAALATALHARTEGNPFFVGELVRLLDAERALGTASGGTTSARSVIPASVKTVVRRRAGELSAEAAELLGVASIIGRDVELPLVAEVLGKLEEELLDVLEEVEASGLLVGHGENPETLRFSHALVRESLYDALSRRDRLRLHRRVGEAIESLHAVRLDDHLASLAYHFSQAAFGEQVAKAVDYLERAGGQAQQGLAFESAAELYAEALRLLEAHGSADEHRVARLLLARARSLLDSGEPTRGKEVAWRAIEVARSLGNAELVIDAARSLLATDFTTAYGEPLVEALEEAIAALAPDDDPHHIAGLAARCRAGYFVRHIDALRSMSHEAVERARGLGDPELLRYALASRSTMLLGSPATAERARVAAEWLVEAERAGDEFDECQSHLYRMDIAMSSADADGLERELGECERLSAAMRRPPILEGPLLDVRTTVLLCQGRLDEAEPLIHRAFALSQRADVQRAFGIFAGKIGLLRRVQGRLAEFGPQLTSQVGELADWMVLALLAGLGQIHLASGRPDAARGELAAAMEAEDLLQRADLMQPLQLGMLAELAAWLDSAEAARRLYDLLLPFDGGYACAYGTNCWGTAARGLGLLATTLERWDAAEAHFEDALATDRRMGFRLWEAHVLHDLARMRLLRGLAGDAQAARGMLDEGAGLARELGLSGLLAEIEALRRNSPRRRGKR
jgi:DNA-binding winged helix-turn-helix (wHTH) protein/tetratricopeptide (TPR) repeat protein